MKYYLINNEEEYQKRKKFRIYASYASCFGDSANLKPTDK